MPDSVVSTTGLTSRDRFAWWSRDRTRFGDTDLLGHVNNAVFSTFLETGRVDFLWDPAGAPPPDGFSVVIARLVLDYRAELRFGEDIDIGTTVLAVGRSSMTLGQGLFRGPVCVASAQTVLVLIDTATRRAAPLPEAMRARLERCVAEAAP